MTKPCKDCEKEGITTNRPAPYPGPRCTSHHRAKKKADALRSHARRTEANFGITGEEYWELYAAQEECCAICQRSKGVVRKLAVDHDHETGIIRGLLCYNCNLLLIGRNNPETLQRALDYLKNPPAIEIIGIRRVEGNYEC